MGDAWRAWCITLHLKIKLCTHATPKNTSAGPMWHVSSIQKTKLSHYEGSLLSRLTLTVNVSHLHCDTQVPSTECGVCHLPKDIQLCEQCIWMRLRTRYVGTCHAWEDTYSLHLLTISGLV